MVFEGETGIDDSKQRERAENDAQVPDEHDGRSGKATGFNPRDAPPDKVDYYERLSDWNERRWQTVKNDRRRADARRAAKTYMGRFEPPVRNQERVIHLIDKLDDLEMGPIPYEITVLAIITLVANERGRWIRDERMFNQLLIDLDGSRKGIRKARQVVRDEVM